MHAYTGGLDPAPGRLATAGGPKGWHDLAVRVQGPAALAIYQHYQRLWAEQQKSAAEIFNIAGKEIVSHTTDTATVPDRRAAPKPAQANQLVQVLRTVPKMRFSATGPAILEANPVLRMAMTTAAGFARPPVSFAPEGLFEYKVALKKAIEGAERYIFIADQGFYSQEIMDWINARLKKVPQLKVILVYGADPGDAPQGLFRESIGNHLIKGIPNDPTTGQPQGVVLYGWPETCVHAKVTIVDDSWCAVGSANCMRRSLYTDVELSIGVLDVRNPADQPSFAKLLRRDLWGRYCGIRLKSEEILPDYIEPGLVELLDLDKALGIWQDHWGKRPAEAKLRLKPFDLKNLKADIPYSPDEYELTDLDSRKEF
jgi:phosphatidylserine/phosphatidylglycerophosphate/cardiolipin synthase-like enzyme